MFSELYRLCSRRVSAQQVPVTFISSNQLHTDRRNFPQLLLQVPPNMSEKLMDTEPGGESTQYESIKTVDVPPAKEGGRMGKPETESATSGSNATSAADKAGRGEKTAENIRYGQNVSESGQGGMTTNSSGFASGEGYGDVEGQRSESMDGARAAEGYGRSQDMDKTVGG